MGKAVWECPDYILDFPEMSDEEWDGLSEELQDKYNHKIKLRIAYKTAMDEYNTSMSLVGPATLTVAGLVITLFWIWALVVAALGIIWALIRVISRSHAYQRYKDTEMAFKEVL